MSEEKELLYTNGVYKHFKGGLYTVLTCGTDVDNMKNKVVYQSHSDSTIWVRNYDEFTGCKEVNGKSIKRFEYQGSVNLEQFFFKEGE